MTKVRYQGREENTPHTDERINRRVAKHLNRLVGIKTITGERYQSRTHGFTTTHEVVIIRASNGYVRFEHVCWGYGGNGPHQLLRILVKAGVSQSIAEKVAFTAPRNDPHLGVDWKIDFNTGMVTFYRLEQISIAA